MLLNKENRYIASLCCFFELLDNSNTYTTYDTGLVFRHQFVRCVLGLWHNRHTTRNY